MNMMQQFFHTGVSVSFAEQDAPILKTASEADLASRLYTEARGITRELEQIATADFVDACFQTNAGREDHKLYTDRYYTNVNPERFVFKGEYRDADLNIIRNVVMRNRITRHAAINTELVQLGFKPVELSSSCQVALGLVF